MDLKGRGVLSVEIGHRHPCHEHQFIYPVSVSNVNTPKYLNSLCCYCSYFPSKLSPVNVGTLSSSAVCFGSVFVHLKTVFTYRPTKRSMCTAAGMWQESADDDGR